jgi:hypothetical protein
MRVGIVLWQGKKSFQPRQSGSCLYSSGVKTRSVARWAQMMISHRSEVIWNAIVERIVNRREYCRGHHREEQSSKLCGGCRKVFHSWLYQPSADCVAYKTCGLVNIQLLHESHAVRFGRFHANTQEGSSILRGFSFCN